MTLDSGKDKLQWEKGKQQIKVEKEKRVEAEKTLEKLAVDYAKSVKECDKLKGERDELKEKFEDMEDDYTR